MLCLKIAPYIFGHPVQRHININTGRGRSLTLHSDGNCSLFYFKKEECKFCRIPHPTPPHRNLVLCLQIPGRQLHFIKSLTSYCRSVVSSYKNTITAGSHIPFCDVLMTTYHCELMRYEVMPSETAQLAEWLKAVLHCDNIEKQLDSNFREAPDGDRKRLRHGVTLSPTYTGRDSISKEKTAGSRFFSAAFPRLVYLTKIPNLCVICQLVLKIALLYHLFMVT